MILNFIFELYFFLLSFFYKIKTESIVESKNIELNNIIITEINLDHLENNYYILDYRQHPIQV